MGNPKKDKKRKAAKREKKELKRANRTAITLTPQKKTLDNDENVWDRRIPMSNDDRPLAYDFTDGNERLVTLWDAQSKEDQIALLAVERSHLLDLLQDSLGVGLSDESKFPEPPKKDVKVFQAMFLRSLQKILPTPKRGQPCRIQLHSLSAEEMNGQFGIRRSYNEDLQRWHVQLEVDGRVIHVKEMNMNIVDTPNHHRGVALLEPAPTLLNVIIFEILKDRLCQLSVVEKSVISTWALVLYLLWTYSPYNSWSVICGLYLFITFQGSPECHSLRTYFATTVQHTLCTDRSSTEHMQWKSDSYLAASLLLLLVRSSSTLFVVMYQIFVPYFMFTMEKCGGKHNTKDDKKCFNRMRVGFSWLNKFILLWYAWHVSWWSLLTVCVVIFTEKSKLGFSIFLFAIAWLMTNGRIIVSGSLSLIDSNRTLEKYAQKFKLLLFVLFSVLYCLFCVYTWERVSLWFLLLRIGLSLIMLSSFPEYCIIGLSLTMVVVSKTFQCVQFFVDRIKLLLSTCRRKSSESSGTHYGFSEEEWDEVERQMKEDEEQEQEQAKGDAMEGID